MLEYSEDLSLQEEVMSEVQPESLLSTECTIMDVTLPFEPLSTEVGSLPFIGVKEKYVEVIQQDTSFRAKWESIRYLLEWFDYPLSALLTYFPKAITKSQLQQCKRLQKTLTSLGLRDKDWTFNNQVVCILTLELGVLKNFRERCAFRSCLKTINLDYFLRLSGEELLTKRMDIFIHFNVTQKKLVDQWDYVLNTLTNRWDHIRMYYGITCRSSSAI
jgi:hypothetical protein